MYDKEIEINYFDFFDDWRRDDIIYNGKNIVIYYKIVVLHNIPVLVWKIEGLEDFEFRADYHLILPKTKDLSKYFYDAIEFFLKNPDYDNELFDSLRMFLGL